MAKILGIVILFILSSYIGYYYGELYKKRCKSLKELQKALVFMNTEIFYSNTLLPDAFLSVSNKLSGSIKDLFFEISKNLNDDGIDSVYDSFYKSYEQNKYKFNFKDEDLSIINDFFSSLGESSVYGQEKIFTLTLERLKKNQSEAEHDAKVCSKMYRILGICIGLMLGIIFI